MQGGAFPEDGKWRRLAAPSRPIRLSRITRSGPMMMMKSGEGSEYEEGVVTWPCFLRYWNKNFSHITISKNKSAEDTCTDCYVLCNEFRMRPGFWKRQEFEERDDDVGTEIEDEDDKNLNHLCEQEIKAEIERTDGAVVEMAQEHVCLYQIQRPHLILCARLDITPHLPSLFRWKVVLTIDMGQNLCLSNLEAQQPGDMYYYFSPPTILLLFGVVNNATDEHLLHLAGI